MASFLGFLLALALNITAIMASTSVSQSSYQLKLETIEAAPALLPTAPLNPSTEFSPDISPLLPSSGGVVPSTGYSIPTIPSTPSQNPHETAAFGPDSAFSPLAQLPESSAMSINSFNLAVLVSLLCWSVQLFAA